MTKPSIDWTQVHPEFVWLAQDVAKMERDEVVRYIPVGTLFQSKPSMGPHGYWQPGSSYASEYEDAGIFASFIPGDCPSEESLVERPSIREVSLTILGQPYSKANSRKLVTRGLAGRPMLIKSAKALSYEASAKLQILRQASPFESDLSATIHIYYASRRPDLDESVILDVMQGKIYTNDRQIKEKHIFWHLDKENPRAEIVIREIAT